jgi:putative CocE/NonD family hydrolase
MGTPTPVYLNANGAAGFDRPAGEGHDDYVSDPAKPVPYLPRPIGGGQWKTWLVQDQRFVTDRTDVISYSTAPLTTAVHIMGPPQVDLFAATTGTDSDWVVKLIDVYPNEAPEGASQGSKQDMSGYELPIGIEIFRGRYVDSFARPRALRAGEVEHYRWGLPNVNHVFLPGHRIMVQVQSSLFPVYDRNPQTFVPNIFYAKAGDYRKAMQSVFRGGATASAVLLPIVP